jgi:preprotein translocase subunit YajC
VNLAATTNSGGGSYLPLLLMVGLLFVMYLVVIRPQSRKRKEMAEMQQTVDVGSDVLTIGGLYGRVVGTDDESVTLEVAPGVTNRYARGAIGRVVSGDTAGTPAMDGAESAAPTEVPPTKD